MIGDITQQNLYLIIPSKVSRIADILTTKENPRRHSYHQGDGGESIPRHLPDHHHTGAVRIHDGHDVLRAIASSADDSRASYLSAALC